MSIDLDSFEAKLSRLKDAANVKTDTAFAHLLGITQGGFSGAKKRKTIPHKWFVKIATDFNVNLEWLVSGTGEKDVEKTGESVAALKARIAELEAKLAEAEKKADQAKDDALKAYRLGVQALQADTDVIQRSLPSPRRAKPVPKDQEHRSKE